MSERTNKPVSREHPLWSGCFSLVYNIAHLRKSFNELLKNEVARYNIMKALLLFCLEGVEKMSKYKDKETQRAEKYMRVIH